MVRKYCSARDKKVEFKTKGFILACACLEGHLAVFYADSSLTRPVALSANKSYINTNRGLCQVRGETL